MDSFNDYSDLEAKPRYRNKSYDLRKTQTSMKSVKVHDDIYQEYMTKIKGDESFKPIPIQRLGFQDDSLKVKSIIKLSRIYT